MRFELADIVWLSLDWPGEWRRGTFPLGSLRSVREPLGSSGSHHPAFGFIHTVLE